MVIPPTKDDGTSSVNKPKRGTSPSNHNASTTMKRNPRHPTTTSSSTSSSSEKPVPNYLRSTASSRTEPPKDVRKKTPPSSESTAKKPVLTRRSSFDRPPVPSHLQKILSPASRERSLNIRSSSFSGKSGISYRPVSERTSTGHSKTPKAISKPQQANNLGGRSVAKKSGPAVSASSSLSTKKKDDLGNASNVLDASNMDNPGTGSVLENNNKSPPKEEMEEIGEPVDMESKKVMAQEDSDVFNEDHRIAHSENNVNNTDKEETHAEDNVVSAAEEDDKNSLAAAETQTEEVQKEKDREETVSDNLKGEDEEVEVADGVAAGEAEDRKEDERVVEGVDELQDEKEAGDVVEEIGDPVMTSGEKQSEGEQGNEEEEKQTAEKTIAKQRSHKAVHPGKKEVAQANNDVIEETASKLMEKRKNKVKALVGAFETVISLQEPEA